MYDTIYELIADKLVEDGYVFIEDVLSPILCKSLLEYSMNQTNFKKAGISSTRTLHLDNTKRRDSILWLDNDASIQSAYLDFINGLEIYLNRTLYLGLSYFESHFSIYEKGDFYERHLDSFKNSKNRVISTVYYLNNNWIEEDGGELIIYNNEGDFLIKVSPKANTLIVFLSEKFPHEVLVTQRKRYSIAGWFR